MIGNVFVRTLLAGVCLLSLAGCASTGSKTTSASAGTHFILVPHAEVEPGDLDDPHLSAAGQHRAQALATLLADVSLTTLYHDEFRRTRETATPTLAMHPSAMANQYFSRGPLDETARQWRQQPTGGTVLVIGEADTLAPLARGLCACPVTPLRAGESDRLIRIDINAAGHASLRDNHDGAPSP
ncbi:histidine phosphatase family protein [Pseudoxanthomonas sp. GM95]|uniref:histidine phosphatase family protein n=1 Tax=Pseudoxanthomonas sp. GM95 TaxID=1881043 RepID=UPI0015870A0C|nr:histidine phosphatase family protein [Pseudoxanthomonas sp. GM95]